MYYIKKKHDDMRWRDHAKCKGMNIDMFFPERGVPYSSIKATKAICKACPVMMDCLNMILNTENDNFGIYGGTTPKERRKIRSERSFGDPDFLPAGLIPNNEPKKALALGVQTKERVA
jgi:WhiB family redox-sensing transcriptional regulator